MIVETLNSLTAHHMAQCKPYADYVRTIFAESTARDLRGVPFLPVRAFKEFDLKSIPDEAVYKIMQSSGTSGKHSRIYLDKETAQLQTRTLVKIFGDFFGKGRFPMLVIDSESTVNDRNKFSARTAAINGFSMFSRGRCFALNDDMKLDVERVKQFIEAQGGRRIFIFGFTFLVWSEFAEVLRSLGQEIDLSNAFVLHGGGWKKLESQKVSNERFKQVIAGTTGCVNVHNYYGMVEQTGAIFMECTQGNLHASDQSDIIIRNSNTHEPLGHGQKGLIQVMSTIQYSYPGHSLLTEDIGFTTNGGDCSCGRSGTILNVLGRLEKAEVRGCSDAYT
jgi:phenylacetate-coenzyme A ligase PaaK-like adenylate-forming protein